MLSLVRNWFYDAGIPAGHVPSARHNAEGSMVMDNVVPSVLKIKVTQSHQTDPWQTSYGKNGTKRVMKHCCEISVIPYTIHLKVLTLKELLLTF